MRELSARPRGHAEVGATHAQPHFACDHSPELINTGSIAGGSGVFSPYAEFGQTFAMHLWVREDRVKRFGYARSQIVT
jgi:hypothetical protein